MYLMLYTDGDSGLFNLNGERFKESIWSDTYIFDLSSENEKKEFLNAWENRKLGMSNKMLEILNFRFNELQYFLLNDIETKLENGNYYIKLFKEFNINKI
jgi:hypothetical protein